VDICRKYVLFHTQYWHGSDLEKFIILTLPLEGMPWLRWLVYGVSMQRLVFIPGQHIWDLRWTDWDVEVAALSRSIFL
jgi:hypothetical protein